MDIDIHRALQDTHFLSPAADSGSRILPELAYANNSALSPPVPTEDCILRSTAMVPLRLFDLTLECVRLLVLSKLAFQYWWAEEAVTLELSPLL